MKWEGLILGALLASGLLAPWSVRAENMIQNGGFEEGATGWNLPALYTIDSTVAHNGQQSLQYHNEAGGPYLIAGQGMPLRPGKCYRMSVWVKAEGIVSSDTGATISMEWGGKEGYVGGSYPPGITGTSDWQQIVFETGVVPEGIIGGSVIVYGRPGTSGTAWFDDVEVTELENPLARFRFADSPAGERKKTILAGLKSPEVRLEAELSPGREENRLTAGLQTLLLSAKIYASGPPTEIQGGSWRGSVGELAIPTDALPFGESQMEVSLVSQADHRPLMSEFLSLQKKPLMRMDIVAPYPVDVVGHASITEERIVVRVTVERQEAEEPRRYQARLSLLSAGKEVRQATRVTVTDQQPWHVISLRGLDFGLYDLRCELFEEGSQEPLARAQRVVTYANPAERPANATWISPFHNRILEVDGKPFFPLGFYILSSLESVFPADQPWRWNTGQLYPDYYLPILDRLSKSNFNCVIDYGSTLGGLEAARAFMDSAHERGIRTIFSVKDLMPGAYWEIYTKNLPWKDLREATRNVVREFRSHPSLIAWYVNDEVIKPEHWPGVVDVFRTTREVDPWHPTYAVHYDYKHLGTYREACDVIGTDPYTLTGDIGFTARSWREGREQLPPSQPFWAVVQCFGAGYETSNPADTREPTYDEERAATLAAIAEGATGIIYYCFHSLQRSPRFEERFDELNRIAGEVKDLLPILLLPGDPEGVRVETGTLSVLTKRERGKWMVSMWVKGKKRYALLVSTLRMDQEVALRLPFVPKSVRDVQTGEELKADGDRLALPFKALDARVLQME
jgi:hypothetical protein